MPSYEYSFAHKAFVKLCSCCQILTVGTDSHDESVLIFQEHFSPAGPTSGMADGMQSRCHICNTRSRRDLGITRPEIEEMFKKQDGKCAICQKEISIKRHASADVQAHVDHDADTHTVRELLCGPCNRGIGCLGHDPIRLGRAADYIERHTQVVPFKRRA